MGGRSRLGLMPRAAKSRFIKPWKRKNGKRSLVVTNFEVACRINALKRFLANNFFQWRLTLKNLINLQRQSSLEKSKIHVIIVYLSFNIYVILNFYFSSYTYTYISLLCALSINNLVIMIYLSEKLVEHVSIKSV